MSKTVSKRRAVIFLSYIKAVLILFLGFYDLSFSCTKANLTVVQASAYERKVDLLALSTTFYDFSVSRNLFLRFCAKFCTNFAPTGTNVYETLGNRRVNYFTDGSETLDLTGPEGGY